jgi:hypothetical protein
MTVERHRSPALSFRSEGPVLRRIDCGTREHWVPAPQLGTSNLSFLIDQNVDKDESLDPSLAKQSRHLRCNAVSRVLE